jgi:hypothetical protein
VATDLVADRISDHRADRAGGHHQDQAGPTLVGEEPADEEGRLPRITNPTKAEASSR